MSASTIRTTMTVGVLFFAQLRDRVGADELAVSLPSGSTGADLVEWLSQRDPTVRDLLRVSRLAINGEYAARDRVLHNGDEAAVIPPVSGG
ncbi:MAG: molybdopterin converting factor subunit 1 [Candidatus Omnitrophica bacterium]|nr:molybdopterin converting factor subunit 1 [Candidatus Omnitrophota bacterium]MBI3021337.1 molybdopterin converting factor subunit 1 [Candidatus Omnitrophota bacterium]MBI3083891.1 molybdopterin converting factor subunit 1 [Candidatus Omnitrophota bacterium]